MAKRSSKLTSFFTTSPLQTAFGILLVLSLLVNLGVLFFVVLINHTTHFDNALEHFTATKICQRDYNTLLNGANSQLSKKLFAAADCFRDYQTGRPLDLTSVKPLK